MSEAIQRIRPKGMNSDWWNSMKDAPLDIFRTALDAWEHSQKKEGEEKEENKTSIWTQLKLPLIPDNQRIAPNSFLRTALFAATQGRNRKYLKNKVLASQKNYNITYTGEQLNQSDLDTWEQAAHLARTVENDNFCFFKRGSFLRSMQRAQGKRNYLWLDESLTRLLSGHVHIETDKYEFKGNLVSSYFKDKETGLYRINFDPAVLTLFSVGDWSRIYWEERMKLKKKDLARWVHGYISSHAALHPIKLTTLKKMCDYKGNDFPAALLRVFEKDLNPICGAMVAIQGPLAFIAKNPTKSQANFLKKQAYISKIKKSKI